MTLPTNNGAAPLIRVPRRLPHPQERSGSRLQRSPYREQQPDGDS